MPEAANPKHRPLVPPPTSARGTSSLCSAKQQRRIEGRLLFLLLLLQHLSPLFGELAQRLGKRLILCGWSRWTGCRRRWSAHAVITRPKAIHIE